MDLAGGEVAWYQLLRNTADIFLAKRPDPALRDSTLPASQELTSLFTTNATIETHVAVSQTRSSCFPLSNNFHFMYGVEIYDVSQNFSVADDIRQCVQGC